MMEACTDDDRSIADRISKPCATVVIPGKKRSSRVRKIASGCVFWIGIALIGVVAIPAGILFGIIYLIVRAMSFFTDKISRLDASASNLPLLLFSFRKRDSLRQQCIIVSGEYSLDDFQRDSAGIKLAADRSAALLHDHWYSLVSTSHGYALLEWDSQCGEWTGVNLCRTPEALADALMYGYTGLLEYRATLGRRELNDGDRAQVEVARRAMLAKLNG